MKKCKSCKSEIDEKATKCPHCQADQRSWFRKHPVLSGLLVLFVIGIFGAAGSGGKKEEGSQSTVKGEETKATPAQEPIQIKVTELADDFDANQVAAENKWDGKFVEFSAKISNITNNGLGFYNIASKQFSMTQISCRIIDKNQLLPLKNGQIVTVRGIVGKQTIGVIDVSQCEVIK